MVVNPCLCCLFVFLASITFSPLFIMRSLSSCVKILYTWCTDPLDILIVSDICFKYLTYPWVLERRFDLMSPTLSTLTPRGKSKLEFMYQRAEHTESCPRREKWKKINKDWLEHSSSGMWNIQATSEQGKAWIQCAGFPRKTAVTGRHREGSSNSLPADGGLDHFG